MNIFDMNKIDAFIRERADDKVYREFEIWTLSTLSDCKIAGEDLGNTVVMLTDELPIMTVTGDEAQMREGDWVFCIMKTDPVTGQATTSLGTLILVRSMSGEEPERILRVMVANTNELH